MKFSSFAVACALSLSVAGSALATEPAADHPAADIQAGLDAAAAAKLAVSEVYVVTGEWPSNNEGAGFTPPADGAADIVVGEDGVITVTFEAPASIAGKSLILTPSAAEPGYVNWACRAVGIPAEVLPERCK